MNGNMRCKRVCYAYSFLRTKINERMNKMNAIVKEAMEIAKKSSDECYQMYIPDVEIGEVCEINDIWDGEGGYERIIDGKSHAIQVTNDGHDGESSYPVYINYTFEVLEEKEEPLDTVIKITDIELL